MNEPRLKQVFEAIIDVVSKLDMDETLALLADHTRGLTRSHYAAIGVLDPEHDHRLLEFVTSGIDPNTSKLIGNLPSCNGLLGEVIDQRQAIISDSISDDPRSAGFPTNHPFMEHFLGVPIITGERVFGNIYVTDRVDGQPFDQIDVAILETLATGASAVIGNLLLRQALTRARLEDDRARIARDLHDDIVQRLFAVGLQLQASLPSIQQCEGTQFVRQAIEDLDAAIGEIRTTIFELEATGDNSPRAAIIELASNLCKIVGLNEHVIFSGPIDTMLETSTKTLALNVLRELITNVIKHAQAHEIWVEVRVSTNLNIVVIDDGVGIDEEPHPGHGLANLRAKAVDHGGSFSIVSSPLGGSRASFVIPLQ